MIEGFLSSPAKVADRADRNLYLAEEKSHEKFNAVSNGYRGNAKADGEHQRGGTEESMGKWEAWMKKNMANMADHGGPVGKTKRVAAGGTSDIRNDIGGYSIVQAESHEAAAALFADSPHLTVPGATAEVMEIMPMPGICQLNRARGDVACWHQRTFPPDARMSAFRLKADSRFERRGLAVSIQFRLNSASFYDTTTQLDLGDMPEGVKHVTAQICD